MYDTAQRGKQPRAGWVIALSLGMLVGVGSARADQRDGRFDAGYYDPIEGWVAQPMTASPTAEVPVPTTLEELFDLRDTACPCTPIGEYLTTFANLGAFRGDVYTLDPDGPVRTLCKFSMRLNVPVAGTRLCFYVYVLDPDTNTYIQELAIEHTVAQAGLADYCTGSISLDIAPEDKFLLGVAWEPGVSVTVGYDGVTYPKTVAEFGTVEARFGATWPCPVDPSFEATTLPTTVFGAYAQQICFAPPPGACCYEDDFSVQQCADTLPGGAPMDFETCVNAPYNGEFTKEGFTCADLAAAGGCAALPHGACCCNQTCTDDRMNPYLCDYFVDLLGCASEFHEQVTCDTEVCDPRGACCTYNGDCIDYVTESDCYELFDGFVWHDPREEPDVVCPADPGELCPPQGACCVATGECVELSEAGCASYPGEFRYPGEHCDDAGLACSEATGSCCIPLPDLSGLTCSNGLTQFECEDVLGGTVWLQGNNCNAFDPCDDVGGACCRFNIITFETICEVLPPEDCFTTNGLILMSFHPGQECSADVCRTDLGACCIADRCLVMNETDCLNADGAWDPSTGDTTACDGYSCPTEGACCLDAGGCAIMSEAACAGQGTYAGDGVPCGWACNTGACCMDVGGCVDDQVQGECLASGGNYAGALTHCDVGTCADCNTNGVLDAIDIAIGDSLDCNADSVPDECEIDEHSTAPGGPFFCLVNCDPDCNSNGVPDTCDVDSGLSADCNTNGVPDECEVAAGSTPDCNTNGIPDGCEPDCNDSGFPDDFDVKFGLSPDCNDNSVPDECEIDEHSTAPGGPFFCLVNCDPDCNSNGLPDECDVALGLSEDCTANGTPDECEPDCNGNDVADSCDILDGTSTDCTANGIPDECELDCNTNGVADSCDILGGTSADCTDNGIPDECEPDCNGNGIADSCDIASGPSTDCNGNEIPDECDLAAGTSEDCNSNGILDECDIAVGISQDADTNGIPDECEGTIAALFLAAPADQTSLWRSANNIFRLTFDADITAPAAGDVLIQEMQAGGAFGADLSANFSFTVESDGQNQNILRVQETTPVLTHHTWIAIRNTGAWAAATAFEVQYVVQVGDVDNDGNVLNTDVWFVNLEIPSFGVPDDQRTDVNGDGNVLNSDVGFVNLNIPSLKPAKPSGH